MSVESTVKLSAKDLNAGGALGVDVDVKNASQREADEMVQLHLQFPKSLGAPLRGVTRVHQTAGATQHVQFALSPRDLSLVDEAGDRVVATGTYTISIGGGQSGTAGAAKTPFSIRGEQKLPE